MLFKPEMIQALRNGSKTETRRVLKPGEFLSIQNIGFNWPPDGIEPEAYIANENSAIWIVTRVNHKTKAIKWAVGRRYVIQPGYGNNGIGNFGLSHIYIERLHDITDAGAIAEGVASLQAYQDLWIKINGRKGRYGWDSNPLVAVLGISDVKWNDTHPEDFRHAEIGCS